MFFAYNPEGFEPKDFLPDNLKKFSDDARYFVHKIYEHRVLDRRHREGFVPLKAAYLRKIMSFKHYLGIKDSLIQSGAIVTDKRYVIGEKATGYRLNDEWNVKKHKRTKLTCKRLIKNIEIEKVNAFKSIELPTHQHLYKYLQELEITDEAIEACNNLDYKLLAVEMIQDKSWFFHHDPYGRVHTNLTNLSSDLRPFLRCGGEKLCNLDIANSQPFFFAVILANYQENAAHLESPNSYISSKPLYIRCDFSKNQESDVKKFIELVIAGNFYDYMIETFGISFESRRDFKERFFGEIFFCRNRPWESEYSQKFQEVFPTVYRIIRDLKKKDYTTLSKLLQRTESAFIINGVVRSCLNRYPDIPIWTIHDSIMTTQSNCNLILGVFKEEFQQLGWEPKIRIENG